MKKVLLFLTLLFLLASQGKAFAQAQYRTNSNTVATRVGNPAASSEIIPWTVQIIDALEAGFDGAYDKMIKDISNGSYTAPTSQATNSSNKYWCTFLVIDSYNLANKPGLTRAHAAVASMIPFWKSTQGFIFLDYYGGSKENVLRQVQPGYSMLFQDNPGQATVGEFDHAAIVKSISFDDHGNGSLSTHDSNLTAIKGVDYTIHNWDVLGTLKNVCTSPGVCHPTYSVIGFGTAR